MIVMSSWLLVFLCLGFLGGCTAILPNGNNLVKSPWYSFQEAMLTYEQVTPNKTTLDELKAMGYDPFKTPNISIENYIKVRERFDPNQTGANLPPTVQSCIYSMSQCSAYHVKAGHTIKKRIGNPILDITNFSRRTQIQSWTFEAFFVINNGVVVYKLWSGRPFEENHKLENNPLGPVNDIADFAGFLPI